MEAIAALTGFVLASTLSPGGATTLATAAGARYGYRRSLPLITGLSVGLGLLALAAVSGLSVLLLAWPGAGLVLKLGGSAYLLWLAWRIGTSGPPRSAARGDDDRPPGIGGGLLVLVFNPKAWSMTLGAAASFGDAFSAPWIAAGLISGLLLAGSALSLSGWCLLGGMLARVLTRPVQWRWVNAGFGLMLAVSILTIWM